MKTKISLLTFVAICALFFMQCKKTSVSNSEAPTLPTTASNYHLKVIPTNDNTPNDNQITNDGATLGRVLFYDAKLSINNQTSCSSCHTQSLAFADNKSSSIGFEGNKTARNASTIINVINQSSYFWDKRTDKLETMVMQPIRHQVEMGMEKSSVLPKKLAAITYYPALFKKAFGTEEITADRISKAMSQFLRSMTSYDSKADQTMLMQGNFGGWGQTTDPRVTPEEKRGAMLFSNVGCTNCHSGTMKVKQILV
jgi:cytochrome c peroxidase